MILACFGIFDAADEIWDFAESWGREVSGKIFFPVNFGEIYSSTKPSKTDFGFEMIPECGFSFTNTIFDTFSSPTPESSPSGINSNVKRYYSPLPIPTPEKKS